MSEILRCSECGEEVKHTEAFVDGKPVTPSDARAILVSREWIDVKCRRCFEEADTHAKESGEETIH